MREKKDKYPNDRYDRELYIPKGYIIPDGTMLTKKYARFHEDMAQKFIEENYYTSYKNDFIKDYKDFMLMRIHALQVMSSGKPILLYCDDHVNNVIDKAIASYLKYGWKEQIIPNPTSSYFEYIRYHLVNNNEFEILYGGPNNEEEIVKQHVLKRCK